MTFRFANVGGRSALVDTDGRWYDASEVRVARCRSIPRPHGSSRLNCTELAVDSRPPMPTDSWPMQTSEHRFLLRATWPQLPGPRR
jgi:hypothetical protein